MTFALVGAGRVAGSFIARLRNLRTELGPVAAQSYRLASRIANALSAGHAVKDYRDLNDHELILICAPPDQLRAICRDLREQLDCGGKTLLLCESGQDSRALDLLRAAGASTGSMEPIPGFDGARFAVEGDAKAVLEAKRLARELGGRVEELLTGKVDAYNAGLTFAISLLTPLLEAAVQSFTMAGIRRGSALRITEVLTQRTLRAYLNAGKRGWTGPLPGGAPEGVLRTLQLLNENDPALAQHYREAALAAVEMLGGSPALRSALNNGK